MYVVWVIAACAILFQKAMAYVEFVEEHGFENTSIRLTCSHIDSFIAIYETKFDPINVNTTFKRNVSSTDLRISVNQRCSGVNHCSYILDEDCPGADEWGPGNFSIKYACISGDERIKYCNKEIILPNAGPSSFKSEAYVHNPGYPKFYLGNQVCRWTIKAPEYQKIKITILDLSLIGNYQTCQDQLEILDSGHPIHSSCLQRSPSVEIISVTDTLEIVLTSVEALIPRRGVLFHFTAIGCPPPTLPKDAYVIFRNDSTAVLSCCADFVFSDSYQKTKVLMCVGYQWDTSFPMSSCDSERSISGTDYFVVKAKEEFNMKELIAPIIVIVLLFGINAVILFIIFQYRRRKSDSSPCIEEELKTFSVTSGDQVA